MTKQYTTCSSSCSGSSPKRRLSYVKGCIESGNLAVVQPSRETVLYCTVHHLQLFLQRLISEEKVELREGCIGNGSTT